MEKMLLGFQTELGSLSNEIETLQRDSISMSVQLENRQEVLGELTQFVDEMVVPGNLINTILDAPVTDPAFTEQLRILGHKAILVNNAKDTGAAKEVTDIIYNLSRRATAKVREYILTQIDKFKKPLKNYQIYQNGILKHKFFFEFLLHNEQVVAKEVQEEYIETMSKVYFSYFKEYAYRLAKIQTSEIPSKDHVLAAPEEVKGKSQFFCLGSRAELLSDLEVPAVVPHAWNDLKLPYEAVFRSLIFTLVDNACREYLFLGEFFLLRGQQLQELFHRVMERSSAHVLSVVNEGTSSSWDSVGILLCAHIVLRLQMVTHKRAVPALDDFFSRSLNSIWPAFERSINANIHSLHSCEIMPTEDKPHFITRRFAELSSGLTVIDAGFPNEKVRKAIGFLQDEMFQNIMRMAAAFLDRTKQLVFLINNYDIILSVRSQQGLEPKESDKFRGGLMEKSTEYAEEILSPHFGLLIQFVKEVDHKLNDENMKTVQWDESRVQNIIIAFSNNWRSALDTVYREVMSSFPSFQTGAGVIQQALTLLVQYYHRFVKMLSEIFPSLASRQDLVNVHQLMVEVKKYKPNY